MAAAPEPPVGGRMGGQRLAELIDGARREGARGVEILLVESEGHEIEVARGKVVRSEPVRRASMTVRCWGDDGSVGEATGDPDEGESLARGALAAAVGSPDPGAGPVGRLGIVPGGLGIDDRRWGQITTADRLDVVVSAEKGARTAERRARTDGFRYADERTKRTFANSRGVSLTETSTTFRAWGTVTVDADTGEIVLSDVISSRAFASIASFPYGAALAQRAGALLGSAQKPSGPVRVMLPPHLVAALMERVGSLFAEPRRTFLGREIEPGRPIVDSRLHLLDDGTVPGSLRTSAFDDRGVPPVALTLLREGRVDARLLDPDDARRLDARPTGHWFGGGLRPNNLLLRGGSRSMNAILSELDEPVFVVDHLADLDRCLDLESGGLRCPAFGQWTKRSHVEGPVRARMLVGQLADVFNRIVEVAADTDRVGHVDAPGILVDGFVIEG